MFTSVTLYKQLYMKYEYFHNLTKKMFHFLYKA